MSFKDKVVLITGGSDGIGAATAELFAKESASLAIVGRNKDKLKEVADRCEKLGATTLTITADMSDEENLKPIVEKTIAMFGKLNVLINNAGIVVVGTILDGTFNQDFDKVMNINLRSVVLLTTFAVPYLVKTKGNIVNVSSTFGTSFLAKSGHLAYGMSKAALNHFTRGAALELSSVDVRVNTVSPGPTRTNVLKAAGIDLNWDEVLKIHNLNRISEPEEIGDLIMFLASDRAKSITGVDYVIDNGVMIKN